MDVHRMQDVCKITNFTFDLVCEIKTRHRSMANPSDAGNHAMSNPATDFARFPER